MESLLEDLKKALVDANALKNGDRSEQQRRLAILCTDLEKVVAWGDYTLHGVR